MDLSPNDTHITYLPLAHMFERLNQVSVFINFLDFKPYCPSLDNLLELSAFHSKLKWTLF